MNESTELKQDEAVDRGISERKAIDLGTDGVASDAGPAPFDRRARAFALLPPMLLVVVALTQITCAKTSLLSPWKGGGFGMFSALDGVSHRPLRVFVVMENGDRRIVRVPPPLARSHSKVRGFPSDAALKKVARKLEDSVLEAEPDAAALVVEVWRTQFEPETSSIRYVRWRGARLEIGASEPELTIETEPAEEVSVER